MPTSFMSVHTSVGTRIARARLASKLAPSAMRPNGVARPPTWPIVVSTMLGRGRRSADHAAPARIARISGLVAIWCSDLRSSSRVTRPWPGRMSSRMMTDTTL